MKRRLYIFYWLAARDKYDYYMRGESLVTDSEYDRLEKCISRIEEKYPQLKNDIASPSCYIDAPSKEVFEQCDLRLNKDFDNSVPLDLFYLEGL